ncbi:hypothetical protein [Streptomyces hyderabadensis]|uniref:hypothetical protein n=1 Tax=Streptomyces hyderabadensis TaxID=598549 RepID=UPI001CEFF0A9|nr:hypothetical protein [Streptomyces hyderabadensis]
MRAPPESRRALPFCAALLLTATTGAAVVSGPRGSPHDGPPRREAAALTGTARPYRSAGDDGSSALADRHDLLGHRWEVRRETGGLGGAPSRPRP